MTNDAEVKGVANGKVILLGEHAVVHGTPALAMGLPGRMTVYATPSSGPVSLEVPAWHYKIDAAGRYEGARALRDLVSTLGVRPAGVHLCAKTDLPARAGLGASAALASACARALCAFHGVRPDYDFLFSAVQAFETVFHKNPSGLDAAVALRGGVIMYSREDGIVPTGAPPVPVVIVHSGETGETAKTVEAFERKLASSGPEGRDRLESIARLVERGLEAVRVWNLPLMGSLMIENQRHLDWFGVSTPSLNRICALAVGAGALGAKLTGGGGGGCAVALTTPESWEAVEDIVQDSGFRVVPR